MLYLSKFIKYIFFFSTFITFIPISFAMENDFLDVNSIKTTRLVTGIEHKNFLISALNSAEKSVMISSYDVSPKIFQNENIGGSIINAAQRGVKIYIYFENRPYYTGESYKKLQALENCCTKFETNCNHS